MRNLLSFFVLFLLVVSCNNSIPNVNSIDVDMEFKRLDRDFFSSANNNYDSLCSEYGLYLGLYTNQIINITNSDSQNISDKINDFITDKGVLKIKSATDSVFPSFDKYQKQIQKAFKFYKYYFPTKIIPTVCTQISALNQSVVVTDSVLAISLDKYLGQSYPLYTQLGFYEYQQKIMTPEYIVADAMRVWIQTEFIEETLNYDLISSILYESKLIYFTSLVMPKDEVRLFFNFSEQQEKWCEDNEKYMWDFFIENNLFFVKNQITARTFLSNGPFTQSFGKESPSRAAVWMGFRIIESYMASNPQISINDLLGSNNYQSILQQSKYRP